MLVAVALASAAAAQAHTLSLSNISAQWFDGTPAANVTYANNPSAAPSARWGTSPTPGGPASGFDFTVAGQPINFVIPPSPSAIQSIGTFTHLNFPIYDGTEITSIKFAISADVMVDSMSVGTRTFNYAFDMFETVNSDDPCADGGTLGAGINANGCADRVTAHWLPTSEDFLVGTEVFTLNLLGFSLDMAGTNPFMAFWTAENQSNSAFLLANVALRNGIPEPATLPLLGLGLSLAGLAMARRQRRLASAAGSAP
jgi:hypothetical protein